MIAKSERRYSEREIERKPLIAIPGDRVVPPGLSLFFVTKN